MSNEIAKPLSARTRSKTPGDHSEPRAPRRKRRHADDSEGNASRNGAARPSLGAQLDTVPGAINSRSTLVPKQPLRAVPKVIRGRSSAQSPSRDSSDSRVNQDGTSMPARSTFAVEVLVPTRPAKRPRGRPPKGTGAPRPATVALAPNPSPSGPLATSAESALNQLSSSRAPVTRSRSRGRVPRLPFSAQVNAFAGLYRGRAADLPPRSASNSCSGTDAGQSSDSEEDTDDDEYVVDSDDDDNDDVDEAAISSGEDVASKAPPKLISTAVAPAFSCQALMSSSSDNARPDPPEKSPADLSVHPAPDDADDRASNLDNGLLDELALCSSAHPLPPSKDQEIRSLRAYVLQLEQRIQRLTSEKGSDSEVKLSPLPRGADSPNRPWFVDSVRNTCAQRARPSAQIPEEAEEEEQNPMLAFYLDRGLAVRSRKTYAVSVRSYTT